MRDPFLAAVDIAVARSLPGSWPRLPHPWLPARGRIRARHAFRLAGGRAGPGPYLAIVALPRWAAAIAELQCDLVELVTHILARGATLLLLEEDDADLASCRDRRPSEVLDLPHPRFLGLPCVAGSQILRPNAANSANPANTANAPGAADLGRGGPGDLPPDLVLVRIGRGRWEPLWRLIHDLWSGRLAYHGPLGWRRAGEPVHSWGEILATWLAEQD